MQLVQHIIKPKNWELIANCDLVYCPAIDAHPPAAILLWCQQGWHRTWTHALLNVPPSVVVPPLFLAEFFPPVNSICSAAGLEGWLQELSRCVISDKIASSLTDQK